MNVLVFSSWRHLNHLALPFIACNKHSFLQIMYCRPFRASSMAFSGLRQHYVLEQCSILVVVPVQEQIFFTIILSVFWLSGSLCLIDITSGCMTHSAIDILGTTTNPWKNIVSFPASPQRVHFEGSHNSTCNTGSILDRIRLLRLVGSAR